MADSNPNPSPADLRALMARERISVTEVARRRGVDRTAVGHALHSDHTDRPVSRQLLSDLLATVNQIIQEREGQE